MPLPLPLFYSPIWTPRHLSEKKVILEGDEDNVPRFILRFLVFVTVLVLVGAAAWMVYDRVLGLKGSDLSDLDGAARRAYINTHPAEPAGDDETPVVLVVDAGETGREVAERLRVEGLIKDARLFRYYVAEEGLTLEAGEYILNQTMTSFEIAQALQYGRAGEVVLTIPEGRRLEEIADLAAGIGIDRAQFLALAMLPASQMQASGEFAYDFLQERPADATLEGYLFPDTYRLPQDANARDLIERMLITFSSKVTPEMRAQAVAQGRTLYEVIVLASIVEREAVLAEERSTIASVYLNRLDAGIKLDADPTIQYALGQPGEWWPQITAEDYTAVDSPWNTYLYAGLPPSPIANPGLGSINALLAPADTPYIFFMRDCDANDGSHLFATNQEEHLANYARCTGQ
jgi:UPF0755 protein